MAESCSPAFIKQQRRHHRTEFPHQGQVHDQTQGLGGAIGHQRVVHLQRQHETHGQARGQDDHQRPVADGVDLMDDKAKSPERGRAVPQEVAKEEGRMAEALQHIERRSTQPLEPGNRLHDQALASASTPKSASRLGAG
jgi:hypothetical protein